jgi:predicted amidohydrolase YtcJ
MFEYYAAITRQDHNGFPENGWHPEEALDRISALKMFTQWAAYGEFSEDKRGTIGMGFDADLTVLNHDITSCKPDEILNTEVVMTIVGGKTVYSIL